jgi:hypothetical protein
MDNRPFHDHNSFNGQCSTQKHNAIMNGFNPHREGIGKDNVVTNPLLVFFTMFENFVEYVRYKDNCVFCACCKKQLAIVTTSYWNCNAHCIGCLECRPTARNWD